MTDDTPPMYAIRQEIIALRWPVAKDEIVKKVGDAKVGPLGREVPLREVFGAAEAESFRSEEDALRHAVDAWPRVSR